MSAYTLVRRAPDSDQFEVRHVVTSGKEVPGGPVEASYTVELFDDLDVALGWAEALGGIPYSDESNLWRPLRAVGGTR